MLIMIMTALFHYLKQNALSDNSNSRAEKVFTFRSRFDWFITEEMNEAMVSIIIIFHHLVYSIIQVNIQPNSLCNSTDIEGYQNHYTVRLCKTQNQYTKNYISHRNLFYFYLDKATCTCTDQRCRLLQLKSKA